MQSILAEMLGKVEGCCRGRGGSMHIFDRERRFFGGNAIGGGDLPLAGGIALADRRLRAGAVTACFFGEGAVGEGAFHETMNLAELRKLPLLFVCENNLYAMGVPLVVGEVETDIWRKAKAYRMPAEQVNGMDPVQVETAARRAVAGFRAHSTFDTQAYRTRDEIVGWKQLDPIERLRTWMTANHQFGDADAAAIDAAVTSEIESAVAFADAGTAEPVTELERFVLMERVVQDELQGAA